MNSRILNNLVAEANCAITMPAEDAEQMAKAVVKLCDLSDEERPEMSTRGYEYVIKHHSVPVLANGYWK